ncbi:hypothetical protein PRZ48_003702 [Zasmidium cellare]|uniref:Uncharacterized protein n=1 Tax=Zasmidium cellare TaxID=395010 RepID=A0ABR0EVU4_ZASCE|nr:hypothetical protein PRZ48_003702 [Zasmidium cellare]
MASTQHPEPNALVLSPIQGTTRDRLYTTAGRMKYTLPSRPLRSHSRKHRSVQLTSSYTFDEPTTSDSAGFRPRLRRTQAYSDIFESITSNFTVSLSVAEENWLEESVAKTKRLLMDKEAAEQMTPNGRDILPVLYLEPIKRDVQLRRKSKSQDLRSEYSSGGSVGDSSPSVTASPSSGNEKTSPDSTAYATDDTISSNIDGVFARTPPRFHRLSRRASDPLPGEPTTCGSCGRGLR